MPENSVNEKRIFYYNSTAFSNDDKSVKHYHSLCEIYYLEEGVCNYLIEDKLFEMLKGDVVFIPKGIIHKTTYEDVHSRLLINCSEHYLKGTELKKAFVYRNKEYSEEIYSILKNIEKEYLHADSFSDRLIEGYMQQLLAIVNRTTNEFENKRLQNKYALKVLDYLKKNYTGEITLSLLAERFSVSQEHLSRVFKKETGLGFNEYLSLLRLKKAESILKLDTGMTISEVAFACGFNDSNYFCEKFKTVYGMPPKKFQKSYKAK